MNARDIPWRRWIPWMVAALAVLMLIALVLPAIQQAREAAWRSSSKNNLKQFGLAFHNYHDVYQCFPPGGVFGEDGTAFHGWGSAVWPFMESSPYYSMIDHNSPWDAPVNSYLFKQPPYRYDNPKIPMQYSPEGFVPSHYIGNQNLLHRNSSVTIEQMENGTSETWLMTEQFEDWWPFGSPYNWTSLEWPRPGADRDHGWSGGGAHLLMADGAVKYFASETDAAILQALRNAPPVPSAEQTVKPPNSYWFESPPWQWQSLKLKDKPDDTYWDILIAPSGEFDTAYVLFHNGNWEVELVTDDVKYLIEKFPEITTMRLPMALDDELLTVLLRNKKLANLTVGVITLSSEGIEKLKEFPLLESLSGWAEDEVLEKIRKTLPDLRLTH
jgi:hypothetical protein